MRARGTLASAVLTLSLVASIATAARGSSDSGLAAPIAGALPRTRFSVSLRTVADGFRSPTSAAIAPGISDHLYVGRRRDLGVRPAEPLPDVVRPGDRERWTGDTGQDNIEETMSSTAAELRLAREGGHVPLASGVAVVAGRQLRDQGNRGGCHQSGR